MTSRSRRGFTVLELVISFSILATAMVLVAQIVVWSLAERTRALVRQEAIEAAANVLEVARATPWNKLDAKWAAAQVPPGELAERLQGQGGKWTVRVDDEASRPRTRRVSVEIEAANIPTVHMTALFSARTATAKGGQP
jgi:Tfp pilus assembly protein FimT